MCWCERLLDVVCSLYMIYPEPDFWLPLEFDIVGNEHKDFFFRFSLQQLLFFHRHYFHHLGSSKFEFFIYTKKTYRHLPNILLFQWCFGWNVLLLWKTSKKFFFYNKIIMNMLGLIIGLFLLYYYGIFFHLAVYLLVWYGLLGLVFFFLEYNFFHPNNIYKLSLLAHNIHIFHAKKQTVFLD